MSVENVKKYFSNYGIEDRVQTLSETCATVETAALAVGCEAKQIAKSLTFMVEGTPILIVAAGDAKVDNAKFKARFHTKATMLKPVEVIEYIGHAIGGVCPFGIKDGVEVYLDESLRRFEIVYPAAGDSNSMIKLTLDELKKYSGYKEWVDVCKAWEEL
ncbi:MAG: YbaK/EbsC family protein [Lachnospiraceae bacterium]|jgi:prolyl-tRNA editing enzyme YbaK/EbsC (Cys-tRNA(Pro) deacylase)|nr:YbaK/EbsC family protein [Lachnospiraceae bacterium]